MSDWRLDLLSPIHKLLALAQGAWPPLSVAEARVRWFAGELGAAEHSPSTIRTYVHVSRDFLSYLDRKGVDLHDVEPSHVSAFIDQELRRYQLRHHRLPGRVVDWRCGLNSPLHLLLKKGLGILSPLEVPPPSIKRLYEPLRKENFSPRT